jgi:uncharacterized protein
VGDASETITAWQLRIAPVQESLWENVPAEPMERTPEQQARWILGHLLEFHRRELKAPYWEFFRLAELGPEAQLDHVLDADLGDRLSTGHEHRPSDRERER